MATPSTPAGQHTSADATTALAGATTSTSAADADPSATITIDPNLSNNETDSTFGDDLSSYTQSLTSSIYNYSYENGRRYHAYKSGSYPIPNDNAEMDRLDLTHGMIQFILDGKIHLSKIGSEPHHILDVGTGTGIWAIEMGDNYPTAEVRGIDLSPVQPAFVPPNVKFEIDDCEAPWTYPFKFDYIFSRYLAGSIKNWPGLVKQMFDNTAEGGWTEIQDFDFAFYSDDGSLTSDNATHQWITQLNNGFTQFGATSCPGPMVKGWMMDVGFTNIVEHKFKLPLGPWAKDKKLKTLGSWNMLFMIDSLEAVTVFIFTNVLKWKLEEVTVLLAKVRNDIVLKHVHAQYDL
ncbi:MAG: hypothetical protein M1829_002688 [Trizodia sp. TS-e1964]|nr:MAG: hypothetical protein M1829_002688 [Trizodia sp. TS-e1964]